MVASSTFANGMEHFTKVMQVSANNTANSQTDGFKSATAEAEDLFYRNLRRAGIRTDPSGTIAAVGKQIGAGVSISSIARNHAQGDFRQTGNQLDLAINGKGYFRIERPDGTYGYKRAGNFSLDKDRRIVTQAEGFLLSPGFEVPSNVEAGGITVAENGTVTAKVAGQIDPQELGRINLYFFANDKGLEAIGQNIFLETEASGTPTEGLPGEDGVGTIRQGYLESSNVNMVMEVAKFIETSRAYEYCASGLKLCSDMQKSTVSAAA